MIAAAQSLGAAPTQQMVTMRQDTVFCKDGVTGGMHQSLASRLPTLMLSLAVYMQMVYWLFAVKAQYLLLFKWIQWGGHTAAFRLTLRHQP